MSNRIDADDLAMLAEGFVAVMTDAPGAAEADAALYDLGWAEVLVASPVQAVATAFTALGATGSAATLVDDVVAHALGLETSLATCVVLPAPQTAGPPARREGGRVIVDGIVSARVERATRVVLAVVGADADAGAGSVDVVTMDARLLTSHSADGIDPAGGYRRVSTVVDAGALTPVPASGSWQQAVAAARIALAHQLIASARWMLDAARQHALDRVQFGRPVASFQAIRHKLAEAFVEIEGADAVTGACTEDADHLLAALAKSLAGKASRTTSKHSQQVLAGVGFTTDHQFHLWLRRALVVDALFGSASSIPAEIGRELVQRRDAPRLAEL